jgi:hypothetical protein
MVVEHSIVCARTSVSYVMLQAAVLGVDKWMAGGEYCVVGRECGVDFNPLSCHVEEGGYSCGVSVIALVACLVSGKHPKITGDYRLIIDNYSRWWRWDAGIT